MHLWMKMVKTNLLDQYHIYHIITFIIQRWKRGKEKTNIYLRA